MNCCGPSRRKLDKRVAALASTQSHGCSDGQAADP
jgi:hypothetical protein